MIGNGTKAMLTAAALALTGCTGTYWNQGNPMWVSLSGADEVPPVTTTASGNGRLMIETDGSVSGSIVVNSMTPTAAHIHMGASGQNGPVIIALVKDGSTFNVPAGARLTEDQMKAFQEGRLYVNVHSAEYKGGEIRGGMRW